MREHLPILDGWLPVHIAWETTGAVVEWAYAGLRALTEPFYSQTAFQLMQQPFNLLFQQRTSMQTLLDRAVTSPGIPPSGFIFHLSRCGSTLLARMLASLPCNVVVSEAHPINTVLRADQRGVDEPQRIAWLRALMSALGQPRTGKENRFYVKFDNAHTLDLALIRRAFPNVPWLFLHRDPVEVMVSQLGNPAPHMMAPFAETRPPGMDLATALQMHPTEYRARMLAAICGSALEHLTCAGGQGIAVNYTELPNVMWSRVAAHFGVSWTESDQALMREVLPFHAKNPSFFFESDQENKQLKASPDVRALCAALIEPLYAQLRQL